MDKWSDIEIVRFLDLFESRPCLWNADLDEYRSPDKRSEAIRWIIEKMGLRMSEMEIRCKIKNIRTTYVRYLKRMLRAKHLGLDENYAPTLVWFKRADVFLRTHTERTLLKKEQKRNLESIRTSNRSGTSTAARYEHASDSEAEIAAVETECEDEEGTHSHQENSSVNSRQNGNGPPAKNSTQKKPDAVVTSESDGDAAANQSKFQNDFPLMPRYSRNQPIPCLSQRNYVPYRPAFANERREVSNLDAAGPGEHRRPYSPDVHRGSSDVQGGRYSSDVHRGSPNVQSERYSSDVHRGSSNVQGGRYSSDVHSSSRKRGRMSSGHQEESDGFDLFSKMVAVQLRQLPLERALRCQDDIHSLLMKERIEQCQEERKKNQERVVNGRDEPSQEVVEAAAGQNQVFKEESFSIFLDSVDD